MDPRVEHLSATERKLILILDRQAKVRILRLMGRTAFLSGLLGFAVTEEDKRKVYSAAVTEFSEPN